MSKAKKLGKDFGLLSIGNFASRILSFLLVPLYTSILTTYEYGIVDIINTTVSLVYPLAILVISEAVIRFCLEKSSDMKQIWTISIGITMLGSLGMIAISPIVLLTSLKDYYVLFLLHGITVSFNATISQFVKGSNRVDIYAIGGVINTAVVIAGNILFLLVFKLGIHGYMVSIALGHICANAFYVISLKAWRYFIPLRSIDRTLVKQMIRYAVPMIPNSISWWISDSSDKYVVQYFCGLAVNGIYAVAYKIPSMLTSISTLFVSAWQITAFEDFNSDESKKFFSKVSSEFLSSILLVAGGLVFMTRPIASLLFAKEFYQAWEFTPVLILAFVFSTASSFWGTVYTAAKKTKMLFYSTMVAAVLNILLNILLTPLMGAMGAAIATLISYMTICVIRIVHSRYIIRLELAWKRIVPTLALVFAEVLIISHESWVTTVICGGLWIITVFINREAFITILRKLTGRIRRKTNG